MLDHTLQGTGLTSRSVVQAEVVEAFPTLELKARIAHIRSCLRKYLPENYREAVSILLKALPEPLDENLSDNDFGDFIHAPFNDFLAAYGCTAADFRNRGRLHPFNTEVVMELDREKFIQLLLASAAKFS